MNYERDTDGDVTEHNFETKPYGDVRREVEKAAQRAFHNDTADVRSTLVAADVAEVNSAHAHSQSYERAAERLEVERETFERGGFEFVRITIRDSR